MYEFGYPLTRSGLKKTRGLIFEIGATRWQRAQAFNGTSAHQVASKEVLG
jgi:hypothetical protein